MVVVGFALLWFTKERGRLNLPLSLRVDLLILNNKMENLAFYYPIVGVGG